MTNMQQFVLLRLIMIKWKFMKIYLITIIGIHATGQNGALILMCNFNFNIIFLRKCDSMCDNGIIKRATFAIWG